MALNAACRLLASGAFNKSAQQCCKTRTEAPPSHFAPAFPNLRYLDSARRVGPLHALLRQLNLGAKMASTKTPFWRVARRFSSR